MTIRCSFFSNRIPDVFCIVCQICSDLRSNNIDDKLSEENKVEIIDLYKKGLSMAKIGNMFNFRDAAVRRILKNNSECCECISRVSFFLKFIISIYNCSTFQCKPKLFRNTVFFPSFFF